MINNIKSVAFLFLLNLTGCYVVGEPTADALSCNEPVGAIEVECKVRGCSCGVIPPLTIIDNTELGTKNYISPTWVIDSITKDPNSCTHFIEVSNGNGAYYLTVTNDGTGNQVVGSFLYPDGNTCSLND